MGAFLRHHGNDTLSAQKYYALVLTLISLRKKERPHMTKPVAILIRSSMPTNVNCPGSLPLPAVQKIETTLSNRETKNDTKAVAIVVNSSKIAATIYLPPFIYYFYYFNYYYCY